MLVSHLASTRRGSPWLSLVLALAAFAPACSALNPSATEPAPAIHHHDDDDPSDACSLKLALQEHPPARLAERPERPEGQLPVALMDSGANPRSIGIHGSPKTRQAELNADLQADLKARREAAEEAWSGVEFLTKGTHLGGRRFNIVKPPPGPIPSAPGIIRYRVLVEKGLEKEADVFNETVSRVLGHPQGWSLAGYVFVQVPTSADISVVLGNPSTVDTLCHPMPTNGILSCAAYRRANLNVWRWRNGALTWGKDLEGYRSYLINHEVGHLLGMRHVRCPEAGAEAPVMLPQTKYLKGCEPNGRPTQPELSKIQAVGKFANLNGSGADSD